MMIEINYGVGGANYTWLIPLLVATISIAGVAATLIIQNRNFRKQIKSSATMKIAEMRQSWINSLRDEMAKFQSYGVTPSIDSLNAREFYEHGTKIELLMNPNDEDYGDLQRCLYSFLGADQPLDKFSKNPEYIGICQRILKREWEVLKSELKSIN